MGQEKQKINLDSFESRDLTLKEKINWLRLARTDQIGSKNFFDILQHFNNVEDALEALPTMELKGNKKAFKVPSMEEIQQEFERHHQLKADLITFIEPDYPQMLRYIPDPPPVISILGQRHLLQKYALAIVGSRNASLYGRRFAGQLATGLGTYGYQIVSGLARGIDTSAHESALSSGTIAVVAGGIDHIYPYENKELYCKISEQGVIIAESPFGTIPQASFFPRRNRLIAGLSLGVIIIEAAKQSGSLVTARFALEQGREVFAVPGFPMDPRSFGANKLIQEGATLIQSVDDVLSGMENLSSLSPFLKKPEKRKSSPKMSLLREKNESQIQQVLLNLLSSLPIGVDEIVRECHFSSAEISLALLELELEGRVERHLGGQVSLKG